MSILTSRTLWVAIVSGAIGFRVGMYNFPDWQVAVETAQVTAGLVAYPPDNPFFIYHVKLWTVLHQLLAALLLMGVEEIRLSLVVSGLVGMLSFQALALSVYALGREPFLAVACGFILFFSSATDFGATYPVLLLGYSHTYGSVGLAFVVIVAALFGAGAFRTGAFLLGVAPAVHPSLGGWLVLIAALCVAWDIASNGAGRYREYLYYFLGGALVTAGSLALQLYGMPELPSANTAAARQYIDKFFEFWDGHRQPVFLGHPGVLLNAGALIVSLVWLTAFAGDLSRPRAFLLRFMAVSAVVSLIFALVSWVPAASLPLPLMILMPTRLLNINAMLFGPMVVGLAVMYRHTRWAAIGLPVLGLALVIGNRSLMWREVAERNPGWWHRLDEELRPRADTFEALVAGAIVLLLFAALSRRVRWRALQPRGGRVVTRLSLVATLALALWAVDMTWPLRRPTGVIFRDRTNSSFFLYVSQGEGMLLTGGNLHLVQLRTRRPVLLGGGGLDGLAYAAESAVGMAEILREVYGIDLLSPPEEAHLSGTVPSGANKSVWENFGRERWREIARRYGVTQVMTYGDWQIDLPVAARDPSYVLWDLPD